MAPIELTEEVAAYLNSGILPEHVLTQIVNLLQELRTASPMAAMRSEGIQVCSIATASGIFVNYVYDSGNDIPLVVAVGSLEPIPELKGTYSKSNLWAEHASTVE